MPNANVLPPLSSCRWNAYSQQGEDGIVDEILTRIGRAVRSDGWCVEFGAWDGIHLSNTYNLIRNKAYKAVLIEGDRRKFQELCRNIPAETAIKVCEFISFTGSNTLDEVLGRTPIPIDFDFLSIDIDGCDYFIFESLKNYKPKVICIEYNSTIPNDVEFIQPKDFRVKQGASAKSITKLARSKGYTLVATTECNLVFVQDRLKEAVVGDAELSLDDLRDDSTYKAYIFSGFDGTIFTNREHVVMPWHGLQLDSGSLQQLPKYLRKFVDDYSLLQRLLFVAFLAVRFPAKFREILAGKFRRIFGSARSVRQGDPS